MEHHLPTWKPHFPTSLSKVHTNIFKYILKYQYSSLQLSFSIGFIGGAQNGIWGVFERDPITNADCDSSQYILI